MPHYDLGHREALHISDLPIFQPFGYGRHGFTQRIQ